MTRLRLDCILVVDVEATCWDGAPPPGETQEIIEIGICALEIATGLRKDRESLMVRPTVSRVGPFCTSLTSITPEEADRGMSFAEACDALRTRHASELRIWASYGDFDRRIFESQCARFGVPYPFSASHVNVKTIIALATRRPRFMGMARALEHLELPLEGRHHRGGDDAWNIAAILARMLGALRGTPPPPVTP